MRLYFDYAASTPVDPAVLRAMQPYFAEKFGNPGSLHSFGQEAMAAVDKSRETMAKAIGADFREVIFTGSATEANNIVLRGAATAFAKKNGVHPRMIISSVEHESVLETARDLEQWGIEIVYLPVDKHGIVDLEILKSSLNDRTALVSILYANNEIGTVQPIEEISRTIKKFRGDKSRGPTSLRDYPLLHTDAAQAFQFLACDVDKLGVDLMTLSAHKIYGPKGIGVLYVRQPLATPHSLLANMTGGGQEFGLRSGTENVPAIVGFAEAARLALEFRKAESGRIADLRDHFWSELKKIYPKAEKNGVTSEPPSPRASELPNILNVYFPNHLAEDLLAKLDLAGLAVSAGSACKSRSVEPSYVIKALGYDEERARRSIRFSFGRPTGEGDVKSALSILKNVLMQG